MEISELDKLKFKRSWIRHRLSNTYKPKLTEGQKIFLESEFKEITKKIFELENGSRILDKHRYLGI